MESTRFPVFLCSLLLAAGCATNPATGRSELRLFSDEDEVALGAETRAAVVREYGLYADPALTAYVAGVGAKLAAVCDRKTFDYTFEVLDTDVVNAFAAPGGYIFVTKGILREFFDEAQLAGVIGHEIGHVTARHGMKAMEKEYGYQAVMGIASLLADRDLSELSQYTDYLAGLMLGGYGRENEFQADALGLKYAMAAGYDPRGTAEFLARLGQLESGEKTNFLEELFASHPPTAERVEKIDAGIASAGRPAGVRNRTAYAAAVRDLRR